MTTGIKKAFRKIAEKIGIAKPVLFAALATFGAQANAQTPDDYSPFKPEKMDFIVQPSLIGTYIGNNVDRRHALADNIIGLSNDAFLSGAIGAHVQVMTKQVRWVDLGYEYSLFKDKEHFFFVTGSLPAFQADRTLPYSEGAMNYAGLRGGLYAMINREDEGSVGLLLDASYAFRKHGDVRLGKSTQSLGVGATIGVRAMAGYGGVVGSDNQGLTGFVGPYISFQLLKSPRVGP